MKRLSLRIGFLLLLAVIAGETLFSRQRSQAERPDSFRLQAAAQQNQQQQHTAPIVADEATTLTTAQVAQASMRIVVAKCVSVNVREEEGGNIFTFLDFEVVQMAKGSLSGKTFTLRVIGGRIGDVEITSPLATKFQPGSKYILFLGPDNKDGYPTMTPDHVFQVRISPLDNREVVVPGPTGLQLFRAGDSQPYESSPSLLPLEDFLLSLRKAK